MLNVFADLMASLFVVASLDTKVGLACPLLLGSPSTNIAESAKLLGGHGEHKELLLRPPAMLG